MLSSTFYSELSKIFGIRVRRDVPGSAVSTIRLGGGISCLIEVHSLLALCEFVKLAVYQSVPFRLLGNGSNVLLPDSGISYPVVRFGREFQRTVGLERHYSDEELLEAIVKDDQVKDDQVKDDQGSSLIHSRGLPIGLVQREFVYSAFPLMTLSRLCAEQGLVGLEFAAGIPASLGGALYMNAGAHGSDISSVVERVIVIEADSGELDCLALADCEYAYRSSVFERRKLIVCGAELKFHQGDSKLVSEERARCLAYRKSTQPLSYPSSGSVFRNPGPGLPSAGELIEKSGLSGERIGGVMVSQLHANWIVKVSDEARSEDVIKLISHVQAKVEQITGVSLRCEIDCWSV